MPNGFMREVEKVNVLARDPDLARGLAQEDAVAARRAAVADVVDVDRGIWTPRDERPLVGLLVLEGLIARTVVIAGIGCTYLVGSGDLLRPWDQQEGQASVPLHVDWQVLEPARLAVLDRDFATASSRWPALTSNLLTRTLHQEQSLSIQLAITCVTGVETRLQVALWHLADRWGHVERDGVVLPLRLTHETLGRLVRTRRPSVSTALTRLRERGLVSRDDGRWVLHGDPPSEAVDGHDKFRDSRDQSDSGSDVTAPP